MISLGGAFIYVTSNHEDDPLQPTTDDIRRPRAIQGA